MCVLQQHDIIFAVKDRNERICKQPDQSNHYDFYRNRTVHAPAKIFSDMLTFSPAEAFTDQRLRALCKAIENAHSDNGKIRYDSISGHTNAACKSKDQHIKHKCDHGGRNFSHERGYTELTA